MKPLFFTPEHAVARLQASRAADALPPRVRFSDPSKRNTKPPAMQFLLNLCPLLLAFIVIPVNSVRRRRLRAARRRS